MLKLNILTPTGLIQILEKSGKSWNLKLEFSRAGKSWKITLGPWKSHGKCDCWPGKLRCSLDWWLFQHSEYAASMIDKEWDRFVNFDQVKSSVDILMHEIMAGKDVQQIVECCQNVACSFTQSGSCRNRLLNKQASWRSSSAGWDFCCQENYMRSCEVCGWHLTRLM